jgi:thymidylate synthase (FAD)
MEEKTTDPFVKLLAVTQPIDLSFFGNAEGLIEFAGRLCYDSIRKMGDDENWIEKRIRQGHESILEHASASFLIVCSRAVSHELVRHRLASFSQRSQRFVSESRINFLCPENIVMDKMPDKQILFNKAMQSSWDNYRNLLKMGVSKESARYVLPNACATELVMTMNFRELRHFIEVRMDPKAMTEMRNIAGQVFKICCSLSPKVFKNIMIVNMEDIQE